MVPRVEGRWKEGGRQVAGQWKAGGRESGKGGGRLMATRGIKANNQSST